MLESYPEGNALVTVARVGIATVVITCFPLQAFAVRTSLGTLLSSASSLCSGGSGSEAAGAPARSEASSSPNLTVREAPKPSDEPVGGGSGWGCSLSDVFSSDPKVLGVMSAFLGITTALALRVTKLGMVVEYAACGELEPDF